MEKLDDSILENIWGGTQIPYIVQTGDTLGNLASHFHTTIKDVCKWNNINNPNMINAGQKLIFKF